MADKKISALDDIGSGIAIEDYLHVVDNPSGGTLTNKRVDVGNLFKYIPGPIGLAGTAQAVSAAGALEVTSSISELTLAGTTQALTLPDGVQGQVKIVVCADGSAAGDMVLTPDHMAGATTVTWSTGTSGGSGGAGTGGTWIGIYIGVTPTGKWYTLSSLGCAVA